MFYSPNKTFVIWSTRKNFLINLMHDVCKAGYQTPQCCSCCASSTPCTKCYLELVLAKEFQTQSTVYTVKDEGSFWLWKIFGSSKQTWFVISWNPHSDLVDDGRWPNKITCFATLFFQPVPTRVFQQTEQANKYVKAGLKFEIWCPKGRC